MIMNIIINQFDERAKACCVPVLSGSAPGRYMYFATVWLHACMVYNYITDYRLSITVSGTKLLNCSHLAIIAPKTSGTLTWIDSLFYIKNLSGTGLAH